MTDPTWWLDPDCAWWAKADCAKGHIDTLAGQIDTLAGQVDDFLRTGSYEVLPEQGSPGETIYRLRMSRRVPTHFSTTLGDAPVFHQRKPHCIFKMEKNLTILLRPGEHVKRAARLGDTTW